MDKSKLFAALLAVGIAISVSSCGGQKNLVIPHAVSSANAIPAAALNLAKGDYDILATVTESASVIAKYTGNSLTVKSGEDEFTYVFNYDSKAGWYLNKFRGTAIFGYLQNESNEAPSVPEAEEFARRVAIARLIETVKDYGGDGVLEPIVTTRASNAGHNTVEYQASVSAKIVKIHPTTK